MQPESSVSDCDPIGGNRGYCVVDEQHRCSSRGMTILTVIGALIGYFATLFWLFLAWRVLRVLEKLSDTCDRLLHQKISEGQHQEAE